MSPLIRHWRLYVVLFVLAAAVGSRALAGDPPAATTQPAVVPPPPPAPMGPPTVVPPPPPEATFDPDALTPYFRDPSLASVAEDLHGGRAKALQALKRLPAKPKEYAARFLRAEALSLTGDEARAASLFDEIADENVALSARCHCLAAASYEHAGDLANAVKQYVPCAADPARGRDAMVGRARLLAKLGKVDDALAALDTAPASVRVEMLAAKAQILSDAGKNKAALEVYRQIYFEEPLSPFAERAHQREKELATRLKAPPPTSDRLALRIQKLLAAKKLREAVGESRELPNVSVCVTRSCAPKRCSAASAELPAANGSDDDSLDASETEELPPEMSTAKPARAFSLAKAHDPEDSATLAEPDLPKCAVKTPVKPANPIACQVQLARGLLAKAQKQHTKALEFLRPVYEHCADPDVRAQALFAAQSSATKVGDADALPLALLVGYQFPESPLADDALMAAANLAHDEGDGKTERAALRRIVKLFPESDQRAEALFRLFWSHRAEGRPDRGLGYLQALSTEYENGARGDGADADRGRYWWGRTIATSAIKADRPKGIEGLDKLMHDRPLNYYGLLARSFVTAADPKSVVAPADVTSQPGQLRLGLLDKDVAFKEGTELLRLGAATEAHEALAAVDYKALRADGRRGGESILIIAEIYLRMGDLRAAHALARRDLLKFIRDGNDQLGHRAALACYPLAFRSPVATNAVKNGFSPNFLQGLMREESALDPHARSPVGARGLTQLMPGTARLVARGMGNKKFRVDDLWTPTTNIEIGSVYLGQMLKHFGHPGLAAAAYNAGPHAVDRWLSGPHVAFDEFVEEIPFSETRGYVKRVLRSFAAYQYLYEKDPAVRVGMSLHGTLPNPN